MSFKPSDFFLGVVSFLGVLLPGAVFLFLLMPGFLMLAKLPPRVWIAFAIASYMVGCLLLAASEVLNLTVDWVARLLSPKFHEELRRIELDYRTSHGVFISPEYVKDEKTLKARGFCFHSALSYVRLKNTEAAAEIDQHMADYKLLRCLVFVLWLSTAIVHWSRPGWGSLSFLEIAISMLAYLCFVRMYNWARYLAFSYAQLLVAMPQSSVTVPAKREIAAGVEKNP